MFFQHRRAFVVGVAAADLPCLFCGADFAAAVYEDEPSSIIAYTLSSNAHAQFLEDQPTPGSVDSGGSRRGSGRWQAAVGKVATKRGHRRSRSEDVKRGSAKKSQLGVTEDAAAKTSPNKGGGAGDQDGSYPASPQVRVFQPSSACKRARTRLAVIF